MLDQLHNKQHNILLLNGLRTGSIRRTSQLNFSVRQFGPYKLLYNSTDLSITRIVSATTPSHFHMIRIDGLYRFLFPSKIELRGEVIYYLYDVSVSAAP